MILGIDKITSPPGAREAFIVFDRVFTQACSLNPKGSPGPATLFSVGGAIFDFPEIDGTPIKEMKSEARRHVRDMESYKTKREYLEARERLIDCIRVIYQEYLRA